MSRLIIRSRLEDIKGFMNLVPERIKQINNSPAEKIPEQYGVNALSERLHPKTLKLKIKNINSSYEGIKIISFVCASGDKLPIFRAGQSINIKHDSFSFPYSLFCASNSSEYEIAVFKNADDAVSKHLLNCVEDDIVDTSGIEGLFYYTTLRDKKQVIAFCDNHGIPAIISMAKSINDKTESFKLKIMYCDKTHLFKPLLEEIENIDVDYIESIDNVNGINTDICSTFVSGEADFCENVSKNLNLSEGKIRTHVVSISENRKNGGNKFLCKVKYRDKEFEFFCFENETLLSAFEKNGVPSASKCKVGECGYCRCKLVDGEVETINIGNIDSRRSADIKYSFIHPCRSFAKCDLTIEL